MSATTSIMSYRCSSSRVFPETPRIPSFFSLKRRLNTSSSNYQQGSTAIHVVFSGRINTNIKNGQRNFVVRSGQPGAPIPSGNPSNSWSSLILGMVLSIITPFWRHRCPLLALKNKVDVVVKTAEVVVVVVEKAAEEVEKIAKEVVEKLPEGGIKAAVSLLGNIAKETAKDAHIAEDVIHKVEEVETEVGSFFGSVPNKENETTKEGSESH